MKVLILAGGLGSRLSEETKNKPKPLVEVGGKPIIWHIMKNFANDGFKEFVVLVGYKGDMVSTYFEGISEEDWKVEILETGVGTLKAQRIKLAEKYITEENFFVTYGDDVSDVSPRAIYKSHLKSSNIATITAFPLYSNYGVVEVDENNQVVRFSEKPRIENKWINGGYFCFTREILTFMDNKEDELEDDIFEKLVKINSIGTYLHEGFWKSMNTLKDKLELEELIKNNQATWIKW